MRERVEPGLWDHWGSQNAPAMAQATPPQQSFQTGDLSCPPSESQLVGRGPVGTGSRGSPAWELLP